MPATKLLPRLVLTTWLICATSAEANEPTRVACLGDSITFGARVDAATQSYPAQLQDLLGDKFEIRNFGLGSATLIKAGRPSVWQKLDAVEEFNPHVVVISLGTNDTVGGRRQNWEKIDSFEKDYVELIQFLAALPAKPRIVLCTPTAMVLTTPGMSDARLADLRERKERLQDLCERVRKLADEQADKDVSLLELNAVLQGKPDLLTPRDGVHPNEDGYLVIAQAVAKHIQQPTKRPNIVLFLVDDMGWQDTSVPFHSQRTDFNRRYQTPNMEKLARAGMKFTQAYACSVCSPTRVSLMTGLNAARHRVTNWTLRKNASNDRKHPRLEFPKWNVNGLSPVAGVERTIHAKALPAFLRDAGYFTIHCGKAHFGAIGTPGSDPA
ncbi:MAG: GDSL-type esterase/lipase family protein, partial [Pirellulaceae bacterium]